MPNNSVVTNNNKSFIIVSYLLTNSKKSRQLNLWESPQKAAVEASPYLQIQSVPVKERVDPKEIRYELWIYPHAVRACGGQYSADEAHKIYGAVKKWDWKLGENNRLYCLTQLEAVIDSIIKSSSPKGGLI